jgi:hypothetical protein
METLQSNNLYKTMLVRKNSNDKEKQEAEKTQYETIKYYTKIVLGNVIQGKNTIALSSTFGILSGQSISGEGICDNTYVINVDTNNNTITIDNNLNKSCSNVIISINSIPEEDYDDYCYNNSYNNENYIKYENYYGDEDEYY